MKNNVFIIHDIRSAQNVGSIFRTSEAGGIGKIYLAGYTPLPIDKFNRPQKDIAKTSLGAEKVIPWEHFENVTTLIKKLKKDGFKIIAIEQAKNSIDYKKIKIKNNIAFIVGNEVAGLSSQILKQADFIAEIPMLGKKESLNVSVAAGIAIFRILNV